VTARPATVAVLAALVASLIAVGCDGSSPGTVLADGPTFRDPPVLQSAEGVLRVRLVAARTTMSVAGRTFEALTYDGRLTGPTLRLREGDLLELTLVNELREPTNLHFHGANVSPLGLSDAPFREIAPGRSGRYEVDFRNVHPGTLWYHAHVHGTVERQVFGGLSGVLIVDPRTGPLAPGLEGVREHVLALKDFQVEDGAIPERPDPTLPSTRIVSDLVRPVIGLAPDESQLWRIANIGADTWYRLRLDGHRFQVLVEDGQPVWDVWSADELLLPPGKRFDVLIEAGVTGTYALRTLAFDPGGEQPVATPGVLAVADVSGTPTAPLPVPTSVGSRADDLSRQPVSAVRAFTLTEDGELGTFSIDRFVFSHHHVFARPDLNTIEQWTISNATDEDHPLHVHTHYFQVVAVDGVPYDAHGRQDIVVVPAGGSVVIREQFRYFRGPVLFHCHVLSHEDGGMMGLIRVG
jgi:suppressor of ftsI